MYQFASARRKDDIVIVIYQNNEEKVIRIQGCNGNTTKFLGYQAAYLMEKNIDRIFSDQSMDLINTHIDYMDDQHHIGVVLSKLRNCHVITQDNKKIDVTLKVFSCVSEDNKPIFEILLRVLNLVDNFHKFRVTKVGYDSYPVVESLNIINHSSILKELDVLKLFHNLYGGESMVGCIDLESGDPMDVTNLKIIVKAYLECTRAYDLIAHAGKNSLVFIVLDCVQQHFPVVLERIFKKVTEALNEKTTVEIKYAAMSHNQGQCDLRRYHAS